MRPLPLVEVTDSYKGKALVRVSRTISTLRHANVRRHLPPYYALMRPLPLVEVTDSYNSDKPGNRRNLTFELLEQ